MDHPDSNHFISLPWPRNSSATSKSQSQVASVRYSALAAEGGTCSLEQKLGCNVSNDRGRQPCRWQVDEHLKHDHFILDSPRAGGEHGGTIGLSPFAHGSLFVRKALGSFWSIRAASSSALALAGLIRWLGIISRTALVMINGRQSIPVGSYQ